MSKQKRDMTVNTTEETKTTSNQIKQQFINLTKSSKRKLQALNLKNKLKIHAIKHKLTQTKMEPSTYEAPMMMEAKPSQLRFLNRATTIFSGVVIVGLSAGLLYMARPVVTADTFHAKMDDSIEAAFAYQGSEVNIKNGTVAYHIPRQFQYKWSIGVNDIIKYKNNEVIMNYNNQYNVIGQDTDTYYLLRDENKAAGEEVFYKNFNIDGQNGFVQLVQMPEKYLLTVFVDGAKLSAIIDYEEAPYLAYNMLVVGRTVESYEPLTTETQVAAKGALRSTDESSNSEAAEAAVTSVKDTSAGVAAQSDEETTESTDSDGVVDGELSTMENEQVIQFDFSSDKRSEVSQAESEE